VTPAVYAAWRTPRQRSSKPLNGAKSLQHRRKSCATCSRKHLLICRDLDMQRITIWVLPCLTLPPDFTDVFMTAVSHTDLHFDCVAAYTPYTTESVLAACYAASHRLVG
jgi:hypothetical protein